MGVLARDLGWRHASRLASAGDDFAEAMENNLHHITVKCEPHYIARVEPLDDGVVHESRADIDHRTHLGVGRSLRRG